MAKKSKKATKIPEQPPLTEWQKRNLEFQQRKLERQAAQERAEAQKQEEKRQQLTQQLNKSNEKAPQKSADKGKGTASPKTKPVKPKKPLLSSADKKALPLLLLSALVLLLSLFMISPYSKQKTFVVTGNDHVSQADVVTATGIKDQDYITSLIGRLKAYEKAVAKNNPWVKTAKITYDFPNTFHISVEESPIIAYNQTKDGYRPVLANGHLIATYGDGQLPELALALPFEKEADRLSFVSQFMTLTPELRSSVQSLTFANSQATKDLLVLTMAEGHTVRVPLSEIALKLPYYQSIKKDLIYPTIVDMEVGIYTTFPELETQASETKASRERERKEQEALASQAASTAASSSQTETSSSSTTASSSSD